MKKSVLLAVLLVAVSAHVQAYGQSRTGFNRPRTSNNPAGAMMQNQLYNRPTVSPYLNLLRPQGITGTPNYQTLVRPQVQQYNTNARQGAALNNLQSEVQNIENAPPPYTGVRPTGHTSTFNSTGRYFLRDPNLQGGQRR